jgi:membrane protein implicated in regulation of membrane protease activity
MSKKTYTIFNIATGLLKGAVMLLIILWLLPFWGINIPTWGLSLIIVAFLAYEIVTFRLGIKALQRKPAIWSEAIVGCCGKATTPLDPDGYVRVNGELWHASSSDKNINEGDDVVVVELNRLILRVAPYSGITTEAEDKLETDVRRTEH